MIYKLILYLNVLHCRNYYHPYSKVTLYEYYFIVIQIMSSYLLFTYQVEYDIIYNSAVKCTMKTLS